MSVPVVYDTMLFLQAAISPRRAYATIQAAKDGRVQLHLSAELVAEVRDVLTRPTLVARFPALGADAVTAFVDEVISFSTLIEPVPAVFHWSRHPDDDDVFNLAVCVNAKFLVTWESRILKLGEDTGPDGAALKQLAPDLQIVTPLQFSQWLGGQGGP